MRPETAAATVAPADVRQAVLFAARFELFTQQFRLPNGAVLTHPTVDSGRGVPSYWTPIENPARVREYWADVLPPGTPARDYPPHWCGAFCLFAYHRAGLGLRVFWRGGFAARYLRQLERGELPKPGDLAYFERKQHHALVESVNADARTFDSIDGNQSPGILQHAGRKLSAVKAFYSVQPLIEAMEAADGAEV